LPTFEWLQTLLVSRIESSAEQVVGKPAHVHAELADPIPVKNPERKQWIIETLTKAGLESEIPAG
jgi:hypothetical protein